MIPTYKICIAGDGGSGKTTWLKKVLGGDFDPKYIATLGVEVHPYKLQTSYGPIVVTFWDIAGNPKFSGLGDVYMVSADACIVMIDGTDSSGCQHTYWKWHDMFKRLNETPIIAVKTKKDICSADDLDITKISTKTGENYLKPIVLALREITGHTDLKIF